MKRARVTEDWVEQVMRKLPNNSGHDISDHVAAKELLAQMAGRHGHGRGPVGEPPLSHQVEGLLLLR